MSADGSAARVLSDDPIGDMVACYLDLIGETDSTTRVEYLLRVARNPNYIRQTHQALVEAGLGSRGRAEKPKDPLDDLVEVRCVDCRHFKPNAHSPGGGLGSCRINAPASRKPPTLWPMAEHYCRRWAARDDRANA